MGNPRVGDIEAGLILTVFHDFAEWVEEVKVDVPNVPRVVAQLVGRCETTVRVVVGREEGSSSTTSSNNGNDCACPGRHVGRPARYDPEGMAAFLADYSAAENGAGRVVTCAGVKGVVKERLGLDYSLEGVRLILKRYGYSYGKMKTRAARAEQAFCITQTKEYLDRLEVFRAEGRVEVYLDESYVDVRMHPSRGWRQDVSATLSVDLRYSGRVVMIGAGFKDPAGRVITGVCDGHCGGKGNSVNSSGAVRSSVTHGWVPGSFRVWVAGKKGSDDTYHGNFNAELFEVWFEDTLKTCRSLFGACVFVMDRVAYHRRQIDKAPTMSSRKRELQKFVACLPCTTDDEYLKMTKAELYDVVKENRRPIRLRTVELARKYGHDLLFTPPYRPELQPIEVVWGAMKNRARSERPWSTPDELCSYVRKLQTNIGENVWRGACGRVLDAEGVIAEEVKHRVG